MAIKIPTRITQDAGLTTQTTGVKADLTRSSPEMAALGNIGAAIGESGGYMAQYARIKKRRVMTDELAAADIADGDAFFEYQTENRANPGVEDYEKWYKKHRGGILDTFTDEDARKTFGDYLGKKHIERRSIIWRDQETRYGEVLRSKLPETLAGYTRNGKVEEAEKYIQGAFDDGYLSTAQKVSAEKSLEKTIQGQLKDDAIEDAFSVWESTGDLNAAFDFINKDPRISQSDKQETKSEIKTRVTNRRAEEKQRLQQAQAEQEEIIWDAMKNGQFEGIDQLIDSQPDLTPKQKILWSEKAKARAKAVADGKKDPFEESKPEVYFDLSRKIALAPKSITEADLAKKVGKGLSIADYEKLLGRIRTEKSPLNRPSVKRAHKVIDALLAARKGLLDKELDKDDDTYEDRLIELQIEFFEIENLLDDWIKQNADDPDFDEKLERKTQVMLMPEIEKTTLKSYEGTFGRQKALAKKKLKRLQEKAIWTELSDAEQKRAKEFFDKGGTIQEFIDRLDEKPDPKPLTATNPATGDKVISYDGGRTWQPMQ